MNRLLLLISLLTLSLTTQTARAHVFTSDQSNEYGLILHVTPDDDPVAGSSASLYFDIQSNDVQLTSFSLSITNEAGQINLVPVAATKRNSVQAEYVFPAQGTYTLTLKALNNQRPVVFEYAQRVSRGTVASPLETPRHTWAEIGIVTSLGAVVFVSVIVFNRRSLIRQFTKW